MGSDAELDEDESWARGLAGFLQENAEVEAVRVDASRQRIEIATDLSNRARAVIRQNLAIALGTVVLMAAAAILGLIPLSVGVFAHEGSTLVVCLNSLRLLFLKAPNDSQMKSTDP